MWKLSSSFSYKIMTRYFCCINNQKSGLIQWRVLWSKGSALYLPFSVLYTTTKIALWCCKLNNKKWFLKSRSFACLLGWVSEVSARFRINNFFYVFNKVFNIYNIDILEVIEMYFFSTSYYWTFHLFHITLCVCMFHYCCFELRLIFCPYGSGVQGC